MDASSEDAEQQSIELFAGCGFDHHLIHGADMAGWKVRRLLEDPLDGLSQRERRNSRANHPGQGHEVVIQLHYPVADLRQSNKHLIAGILVEPAVAGVAHDTHDFTSRLGESGPHVCADSDSLSNGVFTRPETPGHGFVDQDHARCAGRIAFSEAAVVAFPSGVEQSPIALLGMTVLIAAFSLGAFHLFSS